MAIPDIRITTRLVLLFCFLFVAPGAVRASVDVTLAWDPNQEATLDGYRIYCWLVDEPQHRLMLRETTDTTCKLIGFDENSDYAFIVRAVDIDDNESPDSNTVYYPPDPRQPVNLYPPDNETGVDPAPTLRTSTFRAADPGDRHQETHWIVSRAADGQTVLDVTSRSHLTQLTVDPQVLDENTTFVWRVRYMGTQGTVSQWSASCQFTTGSAQTDPGSDPTPTDPTPTPTDPTPTPTDPTPTPTDPTPTPTDPTPTPTDPAPTPTDPTPTPTDPTPTPTDPTPTPTDPAPTPTDPAPASEDPAPASEDPAPASEDPTPASEDPAEKPAPVYDCTPEPVSPQDGAVDQSLAPTLEATGCSVYELFAKHDQTQWRIVRDADGAVILDQTGTENLDALTIPAGLLDESTTYAWQVRFLYASGARTHWSAAGRFTTLSLYNGPDQPVGLSPADGDTDQFLTPVLQGSAFNSRDDNCEHIRSQWRIVRDAGDQDVFAITSSLYLDSLDVPPLILEDDTDYRWMVRYHGSDGTVSEWSAPARFTTGRSALDSDDNGLPDEQEVGPEIDLDKDGIPDANQAGLRCVNLPEEAGQMAVAMMTDNGVRYIAALEATDLATIGAAESFPYELPLGMVSYRLKLDDVGGLARVRIHFSEPAPPAAKWIKYDLAGGWQDYSAHAVFADDRLSVEIEIRDGGFGDADGVANGIVVDPSGIGLAPSENDAPSLNAADSSSSSGSSGGGCFIFSLSNR